MRMCSASSVLMSACFHDNQLSLAAILVASNANGRARSFLGQVFFLYRKKDQCM